MSEKLWSLSQDLKQMAEEEFGKQVFAFCNASCACSNGLMIFSIKTKNPILYIREDEEIILEIVYKKCKEKLKNE